MRAVLPLILTLLMPSLAAGAATAEPLPDRVGWISAATPGASYRAAGGDWQEALANEPVATGIAVRTAAKGRAELNFAEAAVALTPNSEVEVVRYDTGGVQLVLLRGEAGIRVDSIPSGVSIEVDTARGGIWLLQPGRYAVKSGGGEAPLSVAAIAGRARFVGGGLDRIVAAGTATLVGDGDTATYISEAVSADPFAAWWREHAPATTDPNSPLPPSLPGATALAGHGEWRHDKAFGPVWIPAGVPADWTPFRTGQWRPVAPWGWTWIDDAPWGFVPSHYGRWTRLADGDSGARWGWVPGAAIAEAAYAPATVAFLGTAGIGLSYAGGFGPAVAWFPPGPGEVYWPGYTSDRDAIRRANPDIAADSDLLRPAEDGGVPASVIDARYRYRDFTSAVPRAVFAGGKPVMPALLSLPTRRLEAAPLLAGIAPVPAGPHTRTVVARQVHPAPAMSPAKVPVKTLAATEEAAPAKMPKEQAEVPAKMAAKALAARHPPRHAKVRIAGATAPKAKPAEPAKRHVAAARPRSAAAKPPAAKPHVAAARKRRPAPAHVAASPPRPAHGRQHFAAAPPAVRQ